MAIFSFTQSGFEAYQGVINVADTTIGSAMSISATKQVLPAATGQDLGSTSLRWDGFLGAADIAGAVTADASIWNIGSGQIYKDASGNLGVGNTAPGARIQAGDGTAGTAALYIRAFGSATGADLYLGQSGGAIFGYTAGTLGVLFQNSSAPLGFVVSTAQPILFGTGGTGTANVRMAVGSAGDVTIGKGVSASQAKLDLAGGTFAMSDSGLSWANTKFDSQGVARNTLTSPSIVLNGASTDRPEVAWYRGARTYPEFAIREATAADSGGEIWAGGGVAVPVKTLGITSSLVGIYSATTQFGAGDGTATTTSTTLRGPNVVAGTTDGAGANVTITAGLSTGAGAGGSVIIQAGTTGTTGTTQNAAATRITASATGVALAGAVTSDTSIWNLGSNQVYKDTSGNVGLGVVPSGTYHLQAQKASTAVYAASSAAAAVPTGYLATSFSNSATATDGTSALHVMSATNSGASQSIVYYGLVNGPAAAFASNFVIGRRTGSTAYTESFRITTAGDVVIGNGDLVAAPSAAVLRGSDASGTDIASAGLTIRTGRGTGAGAAGSLIFQTAAVGTTGATLQTATTRLTISSTTIAATLPVVPSTNGGTTSGSSTLRWSTTFTQALDATGNVLTSGATSGVGYATGAGGTVTQLTSKATGVTLSKPTGQITTAADALAAGALVSFTLTNTLLAATDNITVQRQSGGTAGAYRVWVDSVAAGSCVVCIENRSGASLSEQLVLNMNLHKGVAA